jgi:hypothetical protein
LEKAMKQFEVLAPLQEFNWEGNIYQFSPELRITRLEQRPDLRELDVKLCRQGQDRIWTASHWLRFEWRQGDIPSRAETANLVLLALWLARPTKAHIAFRFELEQATAALDKTVCLLDRFDWISGATEDNFDDNDLQAAASYYQVMRNLCCTQGRLNNALHFTYNGCVSHQWQVVMICYAAAAEALLTYSTERGITDRLSKAYACLVETEPARRDCAYEEFKYLYSVRSDIMHGRTQNILPKDRLPILGRFQKVLRKLWQVVLSSQESIAALENSDEFRKKLFASLIYGYSPPSKDS